MNRLSQYVLIDIFLYSELKDLLVLRTVNKAFYDAITYSPLWRCRHKRKAITASFYSGAYFKFPLPSYFLSNMYIPFGDLESFEDLKKYVRALSNPKSIIKEGVQASSEDFHDQVISNTLTYDDAKFWSSRPSDTPDTDEFLIYKLKSKSFVFSVHFKAYRALYQGGVLYPSKTVKVHIGNSSDEFHYTSEEFEFPRSESYNTILILPNFIEGEYVKLELVGKVMREPGTEGFYSVLSFVDIIGYPVDSDLDSFDDIENIIKTKDINRVLSSPGFNRTPFLYERIEKAGILIEILKTLKANVNEIENYFCFLNKTEANIKFEIRNSEICANYCFEMGNYEAAKSFYLGSADYWGLCKALIKLEAYKLLKNFASYNDPRFPGLHDIYEIARKLDPEYEKKVIKEFSS